MDVQTLPLLAFGFASPWLLLGLAAGGIPLILHFLNKRKQHEVSWAAMRFLLEAARKNSRRVRLEQLLLLIVRTLLLVLLVLGLARPYAESLGTYFQAEVPTHRIIVIDASYSMGYVDGEQTRFERARGIARQIIENSRKGDAVNLLRISTLEPRTIIRQPAFQSQQVLGEIDQLVLTSEHGDVPTTLDEVVAALKQAPDLSHKEVTLISDFQADNWSPGAARDSARVRSRLEEISESASLILIDLEDEGTRNSSIGHLAAQESFAVTGEPVHLQVTLRASGLTTLPGQLVELLVDERLVESKRVDLTPDQETVVAFTHTFATAGDHKIEARLPADELPIDNRRFLSLPVKDQLRVLLVNGRYAGRPQETATHYLMLALAPSTSERLWQGHIQPTVINDGEFPQVDLTRYDCVFLCNVARTTQREAAILRQYVESGGGLVVCLGDRVDIENYNAQLYGDGNSVLPAALGERVGNAASKETVFFFDPENFNHPIVREFEGNPGRGLETTMVFEYIKTRIPSGSSAQPALRFQSGDPAVISKKLGRGTTVLITTAVDESWGTWAVWAPSFVPLMHEVVNFSVAGRWSERQLTVGEPIQRQFFSTSFGVRASIAKPDLAESAVSTDSNASSRSMIYEDTDQPGFYELTLGPPIGRSELLAVNVDRRESVLRTLDALELKTDLLPGIDFIHRDTWHDTPRPTETVATERGGLTRWLLYAALCLLFVEQLMAWRFFYGFLALYAVVAAAFLQQIVTNQTDLGLGMLAVLSIGGILLLVRQRVHNRRPEFKH